jgi:hypothetical protein
MSSICSPNLNESCGTAVNDWQVSKEYEGCDSRQTCGHSWISGTRRKNYGGQDVLGFEKERWAEAKYHVGIMMLIERKHEVEIGRVGLRAPFNQSTGHFLSSYLRYLRWA